MKSLQPKTKKAITIMLLGLALLFGSIFLYKTVVGFFMGRAMKAIGSKPMSVATATVKYQKWQPTIKAVGSIRAICGVNVTTELAGMVRNIYFRPGSDVKKGDLLVELNIDSDVALLHSLQAQAQLAQINYTRDKAQYAAQAVSKAVLDTDAANLKSSLAQVAQQVATVEKKLLKAPFTGRLGVSAVNPGQYLNPGDTVVNLQSLDPIYVDFYLPQQLLAKLAVGQSISLSSDTYPNKVFQGKITTIEPRVDLATRNVEVEATLPNPNYALKPGMFAQVSIIAGKPQNYLTVPQTAVSFNPYGEIVYIVKPAAKKAKGTAPYFVTQTFVTVGETKGEQIVILSGLKEGDVVVTAGQLKLRNNSPVTVVPSRERQSPLPLAGEG